MRRTRLTPRVHALAKGPGSGPGIPREARARSDAQYGGGWLASRSSGTQGSYDRGRCGHAARERVRRVRMRLVRSPRFLGLTAHRIDGSWRAGRARVRGTYIRWYPMLVCRPSLHLPASWCAALRCRSGLTMRRTRSHSRYTTLFTTCTTATAGPWTAPCTFLSQPLGTPLR
jgi:hypothetical protein